MFQVGDAQYLRSPTGLEMAACYVGAGLRALAGYAVAVRARSRTPAVVPTYMSRVVRTLACPAMQDTSVASSLQVNRAVTQNTCRRLCQVQVPLPPVSRHPAAR